MNGLLWLSNAMFGRPRPLALITLITFLTCVFLDFFVVILSLTDQINLPLKLKTDHFFVSGQIYKISRGSNTFPLTVYVVRTISSVL